MTNNPSESTPPCGTEGCDRLTDGGRFCEPCNTSFCEGYQQHGDAMNVSLNHREFRSTGGTLTCACGERIPDDPHEYMCESELTTVVRWLWHRVDELEQGKPEADSFPYDADKESDLHVDPPTEADGSTRPSGLDAQSVPHEPLVFRTLCGQGFCWHIVEHNIDIGMHHTTRTAAERTSRSRIEKGYYRAA